MSNGVSIAFHHSFNPEVLDTLIDPTGCFIFLKLKPSTFVFTVANLYAVNQGAFLSTVLSSLATFGGPCYMVGGDFNVPLAPD